MMAFVVGSMASAESCVQPFEQTAFNVIGMKSALMVGALSCGQSPQYDAFMKQFQPYLLAEQHVLDTYFRHADGMYGQTQEDNYVTQLANNQSAASLTLGQTYCGDNAQIFTEVLALNTPDDLNQYATAHTPAQPISLLPCAPSETIASQPDPAEAAKAEKELVVAQPLPPPLKPAGPVVKQARATKPAPKKPAHKPAPVLTTQSV